MVTYFDFEVDFLAQAHLAEGQESLWCGAASVVCLSGVNFLL